MSSFITLLKTTAEQQLSTLQTLSAKLVLQALLKEVSLSPKPGLVDRFNSGSHRDMNFNTFMSSIQAISPWFDLFYQHGKQYADLDPVLFLTKIRPIGIDCEQAMYKATGNINTHKGGIFAFGLLCAAIGRLEAVHPVIDEGLICDEVAKMCAHLVESELIQKNVATSVGESLFQLYGFTGARGEAASGYVIVREIALPVYCEMRSQGYDEDTSLLQSLLYLLAHNNDTNVVSRGGLSGLEFVQNRARNLIEQGGMLTPEGIDQLVAFDIEMIEKNLSPGGSADLLAITWFLAQYRKIA